TEGQKMGNARKNSPHFQGGGIPELGRLALAMTRQKAAVRRPNQWLPLHQAGEGRLHGLWPGVPQPHCFVISATGQPPAIRRERYGPDSTFMSLEGIEFAPRR